MCMYCVYVYIYTNNTNVYKRMCTHITPGAPPEGKRIHMQTFSTTLVHFPPTSYIHLYCSASPSIMHTPTPYSMITSMVVRVTAPAFRAKQSMNGARNYRSHMQINARVPRKQSEGVHMFMPRVTRASTLAECLAPPHPHSLRSFPCCSFEASACTTCRRSSSAMNASGRALLRAATIRTRRA